MTARLVLAVLCAGTLLLFLAPTSPATHGCPIPPVPNCGIIDHYPPWPKPSLTTAVASCAADLALQEASCSTRGLAATHPESFSCNVDLLVPFYASCLTSRGSFACSITAALQPRCSLP